MKTKSSVKKRFQLTGSGKIKSAQCGKRHNMRKRTKKQLRNQRGTEVLCKVNETRIKAFMPYAS